MKAAIVTWINYYNYGTYLQAYALQKQLLKLGVESDIISDDVIIKKRYTSQFNNNAEPQKKNTVLTFISKLIYLLKRVARGILWLCSKKRRIERKESARLDAEERYLKANTTIPYNQFKEKYIKFNSVNSKNQLSALSSYYDIFISGSDQIWNPKLFEPYFFLNFTNKTKISYASSIGAYEIPSDIKNKMKILLSSYSAISVRESTAKKLISDISPVPVNVVVDPTLLLSKNEWLNVANIPEESDFILCYFLESKSWYYDYAKAIAKETGKKLIVLPNKIEHIYNIDVYSKAIGPSEFIGLINNASMTVTDSFHGLIFSLLFEKKFILIKRFDDNDINNQNSRIFDLLEMLKIDNICITEKEFEPKDITSLDFDEVNTNLDKARINSINYLKEALSLNV